MTPAPIELQYAALLRRLPGSFVPALRDKLRGWDLLFAAEQRLLRAELDWLAGLPESEFRELFATVEAIENGMNLGDRREERFTMSASARIARSPQYPQWRAEVERAFERIESAAGGALKPYPRLILTELPHGVTLPSKPLWPRLRAAGGRWIRLQAPFAKLADEFVSAIANRLHPECPPVENAWVLECDSRSRTVVEPAAATVLAFDELAPMRREFLARLNTMRKDLRAADRALDELRRLDLARLLPPPLKAKARIAEFVRAVLLGGNGALVLNNSFVQWTASETLRRVQPRVLIARFGIRARPKPFSSIVSFEDQNRANPVPDEPDPEGSFIDAHLLAEYVHLAGRRLAPYHGRTLGLLATADLDRVLVLGPGMPASDGNESALSGRDLSAAALRWLESRA